jgi:hypothetical protein
MPRQHPNYNSQMTQIQNTLKEFNSIHTTLKFKIETEKDMKLNFLDLTLINQGKKN